MVTALFPKPKGPRPGSVGDEAIDGDRMATKRMLRERMNRRFDKDGDGELSPEEREARDTEMRKRRAEFVERFDKDGDGSLSEEERRAAAEERRDRSTEGAVKE